MPPDDDATRDDVRAIEALLSSQFRSLQWRPGSDADWAAFTGAFIAGAALFPAARPLAPQTPDGFVRRMQALRQQGTLASFEETELGHVVHVFGNVAVALAACSMLENSADVTRDVSAFLLVKDDAGWRIAAQAWDFETAQRKIPAALAAPQP